MCFFGLASAISVADKGTYLANQSGHWLIIIFISAIASNLVVQILEIV